MADGAGEELYDIEAQRAKNERHQAILQQVISQEQGVGTFETVKPLHESDPYKDTVDQLPVKRK